MRAVLAVAVAASVTGCGGGVTELTRVRRAPIDSVAAQSYFTALATQDPIRMAAMVVSSVEGSPAHTYALVQEAGLQAQQEDGQVLEPQEVRFLGGEAHVCASDGECLVFSDIRTGRGGRLVTFRIAGDEASARVQAGDDPPVERDGARFRFIGAYESVQWKGLLAVIEILAGDEPVRWSRSNASFEPLAGEALTATAALGPAVVEAGGGATVMIGFKGARLGGTLRVHLFGQGANDLEFLVPSPVTR